MILSNTSVHEAMERGWIKIDPRPLPFEPQRSGPDCPYNTTAVDLRLSHEISRYKDDGPPVAVDLSKGAYRHFFGISTTSQDITHSKFVLEPDSFVMAQTLEHVSLPLPKRADTPCFAARVEGKSSFARLGLLVHFTAPTIHAGFKGTITLEIMNFGPYDIVLSAGIPICQLIFERVEGLPFKNDSQFHGQTTPGGSE